MNRAAIIAKIRKCLALAKSGNEHEAALALEKARSMMADLGLSEADAEFIHIEEAAARGSRCLRPPLWECTLAATVARAIGCAKLIDENGDWRFVGRDPAPEIATYAFQVLFRQLKAARADYIRTTLRRCKLANKRNRADAFCEGWANVVFNKVVKLAPRFEDPLVDRYLIERYPDLVTVTKRSAALKKASNDFFNGVAGGMDVQINHGMTAAPTPLLAHG